MATDKRYLLEYLPQYMQEFLHIQHIMNAEQPEFDLAWGESTNALNNMFISHANENGIKRWEKMLGISPKDTDTLEERRFRIQTYFQQDMPYTLTKLKEALTIMCGTGNFSIDLQPNNYHIEIKLALTNANNHQEVVKVLEKMIPANLTQNVQIMWNTHTVLSAFTHAQLSAYTQQQLRNEVLK